MRLSAEEVELLMHRGLMYLKSEEQVHQAGHGPSATAPDLPQNDNSPGPPHANHRRGPGQ